MNPSFYICFLRRQQLYSQRLVDVIIQWHFIKQSNMFPCPVGWLFHIWYSLSGRYGTSRDLVTNQQEWLCRLDLEADYVCEDTEDVSSLNIVSGESCCCGAKLRIDDGCPRQYALHSVESSKGPYRTYLPDTEVLRLKSNYKLSARGHFTQLDWP